MSLVGFSLFAGDDETMPWVGYAGEDPPQPSTAETRQIARVNA